MKVEDFGRFGGLQGFQNRCEERSEGAGEAVSPPSGPQEGARDAQGDFGGVKMRGFWSAWGAAGVPKSVSGVFGERW